MENDKKDKLPNFNININPIFKDSIKNQNEPKAKEVKNEEKSEEPLNNLSTSINKEEKLNKSPIIYLKDAVLETINSCGLAKEITYEESDQNSGIRIIKMIKVEGRLSKKQESDYVKFQSKLCEKLTSVLGENFFNLNYNNMFKVECGLIVGEKLPNIDVYDMEGSKKSLLSEDEESQVTYINFWSLMDRVSQEHLKDEIDLFSNSKNEKIFNERKIKVVSVSNESLLIRWKNYVVDNGYNCVPQFFKPDILEQIGIKSFPFSLILDKKGVIVFAGSPENLEIKESLINVSEDKDLVFIKKTDDNDASNNIWFDELDENTRSDIILNTNISLRDSNVRNAGFSFTTKRIYNSNKVKTVCIPVFSGVVTADEFEVIQTLGINLQSDFNMNNFQFNLRVLSGEYGY